MKKFKVILSKTLDLFCFIFCIIVLLHDVVMLIRGWQLTWFGIFTLFMCCLYLEIVFEENKKVLKAIAKKAFMSTRRK